MNNQSINIEQFLLNQLTIPSKLLTSYASLGLKEREVILLLHIYRFIQIGNDFPTLDELTEYLTLTKDQCSQTIRTLIQKGFLSITHVKNEHHQLSEAYSLAPLWEKLFLTQTNDQTKKQSEGEIFILFEQEFGRPLSPFEIETINHWLDEDHYQPSLIKAALREAVLLSKLNFKYIDRILRNWEKKGIQTVQQARELSRSFRAHQTNTSEQVNQLSEEDRSLLQYNWLESDD
ncbi:MAG TPA: DnaD domain-containing protein [Bacillota bacterium]|nr:DnaD domain-containing protein [Bacillota bacterium]